MMKQRYRIQFAFDGTGYKGWQRQAAERRTVQETLENALEKVLGFPAEIAGCSRTDAGVHALCMTAHFTVERKLVARFPEEQERAARFPEGQGKRREQAGMPDAAQAYAAQLEAEAARWREEMNRLLDRDIRIREIRPVPADFHSRFSARGKHYRYYIDNGEKAGVFWRKYCCHFPQPLDVENMRQAAEMLQGRHDFSAFTSDKTPGKSRVRTLRRMDVRREGNAVILDFYGDGFLYHMVRILTGTLLEVGCGERTARSVAELLEEGKMGSRAQAGFLAPAKGLFLVEAYYPKNF